MSSILIITCLNCGNRMNYSGRIDPECTCGITVYEANDLFSQVGNIGEVVEIELNSIVLSSNDPTTDVIQNN
jgi:hypothetical protein